jgi:membrane-associated phospholipid phosphatase
MSVAASRVRVGRQPAAVAPRHRFWLTQAGILVGAIVGYFGVRTLTEGSPSTAARNAGWIMDAEHWLGINVEAAMQGFVVDRAWLSKAANWVYIWGHWPIIIGVLAWLIVRAPDRFVLYRNAMLISGVVGIVLFATFPVAPPRLLEVGLVDTVTRQSHAYRVLQPPSLVNQYAAMPSFHAGWDLLMGIALVREGRTLLTRIVGCVLPIAMALAVVVTANHYVLDVVAGMSIVVVAFVAATGFTRAAPHLRLSAAGREKDRALSRWGRHPQRRSLDASPVIDREPPMLSSYTPYVINGLTYRRLPSGLLKTSARRRRGTDGRTDLPRAG